MDIIPEDIDLIGFANDYTLMKSFNPGDVMAENICISELEE